MAYKGNKDFPAAIRTFEEIIILNPMSFNAYLGLAECYGSLGLQARIRRSFQQITGNLSG